MGEGQFEKPQLRKFEFTLEHPPNNCPVSQNPSLKIRKRSFSGENRQQAKVVAENSREVCSSCGSYYNVK